MLPHTSLTLGDLIDSGGIYMFGKTEGTEVSNHFIQNMYFLTLGGRGLYTNEGFIGIFREHNPVDARKNAGFYQHYWKGKPDSNQNFFL